MQNCVVFGSYVYYGVISEFAAIWQMCTTFLISYLVDSFRNRKERSGNHIFMRYVIFSLFKPYKIANTKKLLIAMH